MLLYVVNQLLSFVWVLPGTACTGFTCVHSMHGDIYSLVCPATFMFWCRPVLFLCSQVADSAAASAAEAAQTDKTTKTATKTATPAYFP